MRLYAPIVLGLSLAALLSNAAAAFDFSRSGEEIMLPAETSAVEKWQFVPAERGDTVWDYCDSFLRTKGVADIISTYQCSQTAMGANGFTGWNDFRSIQIGQLVLLPSPLNDPTSIRARFNGDELGDNPMGMASEIRRLAIADDAITARLLALETTQLSSDDVQNLITGALSGLASNGVDKKTLDAAIAGVNARINGLNGVTANQVSSMLTTSLLSANIPSETVMKAIDTSLASLSKRLSAVEAGQARLNEEMGVLSQNAATMADNLAGKVNTSVYNEKIGAIEASINDLKGVTTDDVTQMIDERLLDSVWWRNLVFGLSALALLLCGALFWVKQSKKSAGQDLIDVQKKADTLATEVQAAKNILDSTVTALGGVRTDLEAVQVAAESAGVAITAASSEAASAHMLARCNFESIHDLMPHQAFPTQETLDGILINRPLILTFESERKEYHLSIVRDEKGLFIEGLVGRDRVGVTDAQSVIRTIKKAFATAKAKENGSATRAFSPAKAVKSA
jgi:hypothetical protein